jgi:hypothetical protein
MVEDYDRLLPKTLIYGSTDSKVVEIGNMKDAEI